MDGFNLHNHGMTKTEPTFDWPRIGTDLDTQGYAVVPSLLAPDTCAQLVAGYDEEAAFRSRVVMARHSYGRGEYKYFGYPLPDLVATLRTNLYPPLAAIANRWNDTLGIEQQYPMDHASYLARCHEAEQIRPTPLLLRYGVDDFNCLHQDLYGDEVFPLQATVLLSKPTTDFTGGEFLITEQRPRMQSRAEVVPLEQGDAVIFPVWHRPVTGTRGAYRSTVRHGVSKVRAGTNGQTMRMTLGIIFHDAM
jgi:hypothetical protein